jgi:hypothetical protein
VHGYSASGLLNTFLREIGREEFVALLKSSALWGLLGAALGLGFSFATYRGFRRLHWYGATSPAGRWTQRSILGLSALLCSGLIGAAGLIEGVHRECPGVIVRSRIGTDALPAAASLLAEAMVWIDLAAQQGGSLARTAGDPRLAEFRAGTWELDVQAFLGRIDTLRDESFRNILRQLEDMMLERSPGLKDGFTGRILHEAIHGLGPVLLDKKLSDELRHRGLDHLQEAVRTRLLAEAARAGDPATIGYRDLSGFVLRDGLVPAIVAPIRSFARQQQILCAVLAIFVCCVPAVAFRLSRPKPAQPSAPAAGTAA